MLSVSGNKIVDESGNPVFLQGMSFFWSQWMPQFYNAEVVEWLKSDWKVSLVRAAMAVEHDGYLTNPATEKARVEAVVDADEERRELQAELGELRRSRVYEHILSRDWGLDAPHLVDLSSMEESLPLLTDSASRCSRSFVCGCGLA